MFLNFLKSNKRYILDVNKALCGLQLVVHNLPNLILTDVQQKRHLEFQWLLDFYLVLLFTIHLKISFFFSQE